VPLAVTQGEQLRFDSDIVLGVAADAGVCFDCFPSGANGSCDLHLSAVKYNPPALRCVPLICVWYCQPLTDLLNF